LKRHCEPPRKDALLKLHLETGMTTGSSTRERHVARTVSRNHTYMSQQSPFIPPPVLTAPAFLEATAGENILLPIALDGTDGVPAHSSIAITGLPQGSTLSKGRPFGDAGWKLERDELGDLQLVLPSSARLLEQPLVRAWQAGNDKPRQPRFIRIWTSYR
jgi:hypothetical protein